MLVNKNGIEPAFIDFWAIRLLLEVMEVTFRRSAIPSSFFLMPKKRHKRHRVKVSLKLMLSNSRLSKMCSDTFIVKKCTLILPPLYTLLFGVNNTAITHLALGCHDWVVRAAREEYFMHGGYHKFHFAVN